MEARGNSVDLILLKQHLDETINRNTPIFNWSSMEALIRFLENSNALASILLYLNELKFRFDESLVPYISIRSIIVIEIILENLVNSKKNHELFIIQLLDVLVYTVRNTNYENIRKKILVLFRSGSIKRHICFAEIEERLRREGFQFPTGDKIVKDVCPEFCYKCKSRRSYVICATCIQLICNMCSLRSLSLPQFGFSEEVRVCDDCFVPRNTEGNHEPPSEFKTESQPEENMANAALIKSMECPICLDIMKKPIIICKLGHSMCRVCTVGKVTSCPICRENITTTRNYAVENLLENQQIYCTNTSTGCRTIVKLQDKELHESECKFRRVECEGTKFCKWKCSWYGPYYQMGQHFATCHTHTKIIAAFPRIQLLLKTFFNQIRDSYTLQLVNFRNGEKFFWYKQKIDIKTRKIYWIVQLIDSKEEAANYCFEITVFNGPVRQSKVREICANDTVDAEKIFESGKCVVFSMETLKNYMNEKNEFQSSLTISKI